MSTLREAILLGTREASQTHAALGLRQQVEEQGGAIDVFGTIERLGIPLLFRPLDSLLGACIRLPNTAAGIVVNSRRDLHLQRFTAAHELGHFVLEHEGSLDREILLPDVTAKRNVLEVAADSFAAEFLMPRWLYLNHAKRHGWVTSFLMDPLVAYQLSLRMAVSYEAACWGLLSQKVLNARAVTALRAVTPKMIKKRVLGAVQLEDPWADVWVLDENDDGTMITAGPRDLFLTNLVEQSGSGFLWEVQESTGSIFTIVGDLSEAIGEEAIGSPTNRRLLLKPSGPGISQLILVQRRPWEQSGRALKSVTVSASTFGAEPEGLPWHSRPSLEQAILS